MDKNGTPKDNLMPKQVSAIAALLTVKDVAGAAKDAGVSLRTLRRWMVSDATFIAALKEAQHQALEDVTRRLAGVASYAITTIAALMADKRTPASVRLRAAIAILDQLLRIRELVSLEERIVALEERAQAQQPYK